jgi:hypothetical protein
LGVFTFCCGRWTSWAVAYTSFLLYNLEIIFTSCHGHFTFLGRLMTVGGLDSWAFAFTAIYFTTQNHFYILPRASLFPVGVFTCLRFHRFNLKTVGAFSYLLLWAFYLLQCDSNSAGKDPIPLAVDVGTYYYG